MRHLNHNSYHAPTIIEVYITIEQGFAISGSIDDMPVVDWNAPDAFTFSDSEWY